MFLKACDFKPEYWRLGLLCFTCSFSPTLPYEEEMAFPEKLISLVNSMSGRLFCGFGFVVFFQEKRANTVRLAVKLQELAEVQL